MHVPRGTPALTFREGGLGPSLNAREHAGLSRSQAAARDLMRYYALLDAGMAEVRGLGLSRDQACAVCDALNGSLILYDETTEQGVIDPRPHIAAELRDAAEYMQSREQINRLPREGG